MALTSQQSPPGAQRLFLALWPDDAVRAELESACRRLTLHGGRMIAPRNLHVTLAFLGAADAARRTCIEQAAGAVAGRAFEFALTRVEWRRKGGMAWLTASDVPPALRELIASLNAALLPCGHAPESRPYRLHLTLARNVRSIGRDRAIAPVSWRAHDFCLVSSRLGAGGSEYTVERRWALAGG